MLLGGITCSVMLKNWCPQDFLRNVFLSKEWRTWHRPQGWRGVGNSNNSGVFPSTFTGRSVCNRIMIPCGPYGSWQNLYFHGKIPSGFIDVHQTGYLCLISDRLRKHFWFHAQCMFLVKILQLVATRHAFEWHLRQLRGGYHYCGTAGGGELPSGGLPSGSCDAVGRENPGGFEGKRMRNPWESQGNPWVWVLRSRFPWFLELISRMVVLLSSFKGIRALFFLGLYSVKKLFTESMPKKVWELLQSCAYIYI